MCVILHKLKEQKPFTLEEIINASEYNNDGFSITRIYNNGYKLEKTLDIKEFQSNYEKMLLDGDLDDIEYIIHCRIATNGKVCKNNCHPFENDNYIIWHNGIIEEFSKDKDKVDTVQFLNKYFQDKNMKTETIQRRFDKTSSSRFIIMRKDTGEIIQSKNFLEHNGNYISNDHFLWKSNIYSPYANWWNDDDIYYGDYIYGNDKNAIIEMLNYKDIKKMSRRELEEYAEMLENYVWENLY